MDENIKTECKNGEDKALVKINKGSLIYVFSENEDYIEGLPNIRHKHFISSIHLFPYDNFVKLLEKLEPPYTITNTIDLIKNRGMTLIIKGNVTNLEEGLYTVCGKWQNEDINYMYSKFFFY